jgi:integrase/recombinase XerD
VLRVVGKGTKIVLVPLPRLSPGLSTGPSATEPLGRSCLTGPARAWTATLPPDGSSTSPLPPGCECRMHPHMLRHTFVTTMLDAGVSLRDVQIAARHADPRTTTVYDRRRQNFDRHAAYVVVAFVAGG